MPATYAVFHRGNDGNTVTLSTFTSREEAMFYRNRLPRWYRRFTFITEFLTSTLPIKD